MALVLTRIALTDRSPKWGLVIIADKDGVIEREIEITAAEADLVHAGKAIPPGVTREQWDTGNVYCCSRPCREGQALVESNGWLVVNHEVDKTTRADRVTVALMKIPPHQWERRGDEVWIEESVAAQLIKGGILGRRV